MLSFAGIIEGFYGQPWTWDDRIAVCRFSAEHGADTYVYAPKSDPLHRDQWRTPYDSETLDDFARLVAEGNARVGFAMSPGLSMTLGDTEDRSSLIAKFATLAAVGIDLFCLAFDDIPAGPESAVDQGALCAWVADAIAPARLIFVPTDYTSCTPNPYLEALARSLPAEVSIGWTGSTVVADRITAADAAARADALGDRKPWLWDNYPVNDGIMTERLFMGPLTGREPALRDALEGYLANPMLQARASQLPLASAMAWCAGEDPVSTWQRVADALGWTVFAQSCDATHLRSLSGSPLRDFLAEAAECDAPGLDAEVEPWLRQVRREAKNAIRLVDAAASGNIEQLLIAAARWTRLPDPTVSVFGPRRSLRPVIAQDEHLQFVLQSAAISFNDNAIDDLVVALAESAGGSGSEPK